MENEEYRETTDEEKALIERVKRAPERRVFTIDTETTHITTEELERRIKEFKQRMKDRPYEQ